MNGHAIKRYMDIAFRRWWLLVLPLLLGGVAAYAYYKRAPKLYRAATTVEVQRQTVPERLLEPTVTLDVQARINLILPILRGEASLERIAEGMGLVAAGFDSLDRRALYDRLSESLSVDVDRQGRLYTLTVIWPDQDQTAPLASAFAERFREEHTELRRSKIRAQITLFEEMAVEERRKMLDMQERYSRFQTENWNSLPENQAAVHQRIESNLRLVETLNDDIRSYRDRVRELEAQRDRPDPSMLLLPEVPEDPDLVRLEEMRREYDGLLATLTEKHPRVRRLAMEIERLELRLSGRIGDETEPGREPADPRIQALEAAIREQERKIVDAEDMKARMLRENESLEADLDRSPKVAAEQSRMKQQLEAFEKSFTLATTKEQEVRQGERLEASGEAESFRVLNPARRPLSPFNPNLDQLLALGLLAGAALGIGTMALLEALDQSYQTEEQLAEDYDLPILAAVPNLNNATVRLRKRQRSRRSRFPQAAGGERR